MNREQFIQHTSDEYGMEGEYLWPKYPLFCVFRHSSNRKWFAIVMDVPKNKLGLVGTEPLDVVNLKCALSSSVHCGKNPESSQLTT